MRKFLLLNLASGAPLPKPESTTPASIENIFVKMTTHTKCWSFSLMKKKIIVFIAMFICLIYEWHCHHPLFSGCALHVIFSKGLFNWVTSFAQQKVYWLNRGHPCILYKYIIQGAGLSQMGLEEGWGWGVSNFKFIEICYVFILFKKSQHVPNQQLIRNQANIIFDEG